MVKKIIQFILRFVFATLVTFLMLGLGFIAYIIWFNNRPLPPEIAAESIFQGVTYERVVQTDPDPLIYHVIKINLDTPGIEFFVTPAGDLENFAYEARTTSEFLDEFDLQVAINGDFFDPFWAGTPLDYYPRSGDGVNTRGLSISEGELVTTGYVASRYYQTLYITPDNRAIFDTPPPQIDSAISGYLRFVRNGQIRETGRGSYRGVPHPRTAIALDQSGRTLMLFVVDGRQPNYSDGITIQHFGEIVIAHGGYNALNLDGGGSSTMIIEGENGQPRQLGSAMHTRIPARERPLANHFGVYALPLEVN